MKIIRGILLFLACVLGFILQTELFQSQLWRFDMANYLIMRYEVENENLKDFLNVIDKESKNNNVSVFATNIYLKTRHKAVIDIYGNEDAIKKELFQVMGIREQKYTSFISGETDVRFKDFEELVNLDNYSKKSLSFIGNEEDIIKVYEAVSDKYNVTYPDYFEATEEDMICIVWGMIALLLIVLNCIDTLRRKKEVVIRIFLGEGVSRIIVKTIIGDIIMYATIYALAKIFTFKFFSGEYAGDLALLIFVIGALLSLLPYVSFAFYSTKKLFSNVNDSKGSLYALYALKIIVTALTIFTISTNISRGYWNIKEDDAIIKQYKDCNYITLGNTGVDDGYGEELFWNKVYSEQYDTIKPIMCINILQDDKDYILVNNYAKGMLQDLNFVAQERQDNADFIIFINENESLEYYKETAVDALSEFLDSDVKNLSVSVVQYNTKEKLTYFSTGEYQNISTTVNPVIIFQNNDDMRYKGFNIENYAGNSIIFDISAAEFDNVKQPYEEYIDKYNLVITNVYESYNFQKNFLVRLLRFLTSFCVIISILYVAVVIAISSMEYRNNAMEISIKKILGYSVFERNRRSIIIISVIDIVVYFLICFITAIVNVRFLTVCFLTGIVVIFAEKLILLVNILKIERVNVYKVLKGGCL